MKITIFNKIFFLATIYISSIFYMLILSTEFEINLFNYMAANTLFIIPFEFLLSIFVIGRGSFVYIQIIIIVLYCLIFSWYRPIGSNQLYYKAIYWMFYGLLIFIDYSFFATIFNGSVLIMLLAVFCIVELSLAELILSYIKKRKTKLFWINTFNVSLFVFMLLTAYYIAWNKVYKIKMTNSVHPIYFYPVKSKIKEPDFKNTDDFFSEKSVLYQNSDFIILVDCYGDTYVFSAKDSSRYIFGTGSTLDKLSNLYITLKIEKSEQSGCYNLWNQYLNRAKK